MSERVTLVLDDGIGDLLSQLAGGERKRGDYISQLIRGMYEQGKLSASSDFETMRFAFAGLTGQVKIQEGRLLNLERQLAAWIAKESLGK